MAILDGLPQGLGRRYVALLPAHSAAMLAAASRELHRDLQMACMVLCRASDAAKRLDGAASALRQTLQGRTWAEPRKHRAMSQFLTEIGHAVPGCHVILYWCRELLARGNALPDLGDLPDSEAANALGAFLTDSCMDARRAASTALGKLGAAAAPYAEILARLVQQDSCSQVRLAAVDALGELGPAAKHHGAIAVVAALRDPCPHVCARALQASGRLGSTGATAAAYSAQLLGDSDRYVRARAAAAIGRVGIGAAGQVGAVAALLEDGHQDVRNTAHHTLLSIAGASAPLMIGRSDSIQETGSCSWSQICKRTRSSPTLQHRRLWATPAEVRQQSGPYAHPRR